eukprot:gene41277-50379_t
MSAQNFYRDISSEEELRIPLPPDWIRTMKIVANNQSERIYRNLKTLQEMNDHPILIQALSMVKNRPLPYGWSEQEASLENGQTERFFYSPDLHLSMWDHPAMRDCVIECLLKLGYDLDYILSIMQAPEPKSPHKAVNEASAEVKQDSHNSSASFYTAIPSPSPLAFVKPLPTPSKNPYSIYASDSSVNTSDRGLRTNDLMEETDFSDSASESPSRYHRNSRNHTHSHPSDHFHPPLPDESSPTAQAEEVKGWGEVIAEYAHQGEAPGNGSKAAGLLHLPVSKASVRILKHDLVGSIERVHASLCELRGGLAERDGYTCTYTNASAPDASEHTTAMVTLASDIVTELKQHPQYLIQAMVAHEDPAHRLQTAFIALHRLLHPFSTDPSLTTALLLEGINHQLGELEDLQRADLP